MKPMVKGVLIGCGSLVAIGVIAIVAMGIYMKQKAPGLIATGRAAEAEGGAYGTGVSESRCVDDVVAKYRTKPGFSSALRESIWLNGCLDTSAVEQDFCAGVPLRSDLADSALWKVSRCTQAGLGQDAACRSLIDNIQPYCEGNVRRMKMTAVQ